MNKKQHFWHIISVAGFFGGAELVDVFRPDGPFGLWHYAPFVLAGAVYLVRVAAKYLGKALPPSVPPAVLLLLALGLSSCATLSKCTQPVPQQVANDAAAVGTCVVTTGQTLAQCEDAQLSVEGGQLALDALMCGEQALSVAYVKGAHTTAAVAK